MDARRIRILFQSPPEPAAGQAQNLYTIRRDGTGLQQITHYDDTAGQYVGVFHRATHPMVGTSRPPSSRESVQATSQSSGRTVNGS